MNEEKIHFLACVSGFPSIFVCMCVCRSVFQFQGGFPVSGEGRAAHVSLRGYPDGHLGEPSGDGGRVQGPAAQVSSMRKPHEAGSLGGGLGSPWRVGVFTYNFHYNLYLQKGKNTWGRCLEIEQGKRIIHCPPTQT